MNKKSDDSGVTAAYEVPGSVPGTISTGMERVKIFLCTGAAFAAAVNDHNNHQQRMAEYNGAGLFCRLVP